MWNHSTISYSREKTPHPVNFYDLLNDTQQVLRNACWLKTLINESLITYYIKSKLLELIFKRLLSMFFLKKIYILSNTSFPYRLLIPNNSWQIASVLLILWTCSFCISPPELLSLYWNSVVFQSTFISRVCLAINHGSRSTLSKHILSLSYRRTVLDIGNTQINSARRSVFQGLALKLGRETGK